jgi:glutamate-1-semialdehyde 2,1-aminomutase
MATLGTPDSSGVTESSAMDTLVVSYNDIAAVEQVFEKFPDEVAAVIVEPVAANMGLVPPKPSFLKMLRAVTKKFGALLVFDEVITGFRAAWGGAQSLFDIKPDLTCLGKIIGGGLPVGAYGGREEIMNLVSPLGPVYQAGTLSGNPLAMTAGIATLREVKKKGFHSRLEKKSERLAEGLNEAAKEAGCALCLNRVGSMLGLFFTSKEVVDFSSAKSTNTEQYGRFFRSMLEGGVYLPPSAFETIFVSAAHSEGDISQTIHVAENAFRKAQAELKVR